MMIGLVVLSGIIFLSIWIFSTGVEKRDFGILFLGWFLMVITIFPLLYGCYDSFQKKEAIVNIEDVILTVEKKDYTPESTIYVGEELSPIYFVERYNISFTDGENTKTIDNKELFNSLKEGDKIKGCKYIYSKEDGEIYKIELKVEGF